ncbi:MAG: prephenate dehydratase [Syntrophomonadaceae bacterium]
MKRIMAYLGPAGTFCEEAARAVAGGEYAWELMPCPSIEGVMAAVDSGEAHLGIVPVENSCEGSVNLTLDLLAYEYRLEITGEVILPVRHNLLARPGVSLGDISRVLSHPQALAQCRKYLTDNLGAVDLVEISSTAEAACRVAGSEEPWAAIGTQSAAISYGLAVVRQDIQDRADNETRFISLAQANDENSRPPSGIEDSRAYKTSMVLSVGDRPGALFKALEQFYLYEVNMSKIESRPAKTRIGDYLFFIDVDGHQLEPHIIRALKGLQDIVSDLRLLGSYRTYRNAPGVSGQ